MDHPAVPEGAHITARIDIVMYLDPDTGVEVITHDYRDTRVPFVTGLGMLTATEHTIVLLANTDEDDD